MAGTDSTHYFRPSAPLSRSLELVPPHKDFGTSTSHDLLHWLHRCILHNEVDARSKDGEPAILVAIRLDALDLLRELLQRGVNLLCTDQHLRNAVTIACIYNNMPAVQLLFQSPIARACLKQGDCDGMLPLHWAVRLASPELVRYLVRLDSFQLLRKTARGFGVLHLMVKEGRTDLMKVLQCEHSSFLPLCLFQPAHDGSTPWSLAENLGDSGVLMQLDEYRCAVKQKNESSDALERRLTRAVIMRYVRARKAGRHDVADRDAHNVFSPWWGQL